MPQILAAFLQQQFTTFFYGLRDNNEAAVYILDISMIRIS